MLLPKEPQAVPGKLAGFFLTTDPQQRLRIKRSLLAAQVYGVCVVLIVIAIAANMIDLRAGSVLAIGIVVSCAAVYGFLRSGLNLRFSDPSLAMPQILAAVVWIAGAYGTFNESHGATLILLALVLVFGIFTVDLRQARICAVFIVLLMGAVMTYKSQTSPSIYPVKVELMHFVFLLVSVPAITTLALQIARMRQRLQKQNVELGGALARIQELATRDELTGLINRRQMHLVLQQQAVMGNRSKDTFSVALLDLDFFKRVNDTYGHGVGDEVLRNFSAEAQRVLRVSDVVSRWGGEEFLLMMPEIPPGEPTIGIERLRDALTHLQISATVPDLRVSFSAGITTYRPGETMDAAIERADRGLYQAKAAGRNQCVAL